MNQKTDKLVRLALGLLTLQQCPPAQINSTQRMLNMKTVLPAIAIAATLTVSAFAASWSGKLIDAACYQAQKKTDSCDATDKSTSFALFVSGKVYNLDAAGNNKAATAIKNRADRADPAKPQSKMFNATITGTESAGTISVETIDVN